MITKNYCGFKVTQRNFDQAIRFFVFTANAKDIAEWTTIDRAEDREGGIQRRLSPARRRAVKRFFEQDQRNVIPTSIILAFPPGIIEFRDLALSNGENDCNNQLYSSIEWGKITFSYDPNCAPLDRPAFVVDGQHRLLGMKDVDDELPVLVSALLDAEPNEQAFQFVVINNKVSRVPSDLVRSLLVDFNEDALQERLETARVSLRQQALLVSIVDDDPESPLHLMINWPRRRGGGSPIVRPAAVEDSLKYIRHRFPIFDENQDALIDFFYGLWKGVKNAYPDLWEQTDNRLFENAGFKAFSEYLTDQIETLASFDYVDIEDINAITQASETIAKKINVEFWLAEWNLKSLDTSAGREIIQDDIKIIRQNRKDGTIRWDEGLKLIGIQQE